METAWICAILLGVHIAHIMGSPSINNISWISERENKNVSLLVSTSAVCLSLPPAPSPLSFFAFVSHRDWREGQHWEDFLSSSGAVE